jgi:hypothetical protein
MGNLQLIQGQKDHEAYRRSLNQLSLDVVEYDVEAWYQSGWWDDTFLCYSYLDGGNVVANMSTYKMSFLIEGKSIDGLQTCFAITHPAYRKQGLCENLFKMILQMDISQPCIVYGLTMHESMKHLQLRHDFHLQKQSEFFFTLPEKTRRYTPEKRRKRQLDMTNAVDRQTLMTFARERIPLSQTFHVENAHHMLLFHCLSIFKNALYLLPDDDVIVIYKREGAKLHLYDLLARKEIGLSQVLEPILEEDTREVIFYFTPPESSDFQILCRDLPTEEAFFTKPSLNFTGNIRYPILG